MKLQQMMLRNFRNYIDSTLIFDELLTIFVGPNAQGKTNILEAIHLGSIGRSHRTGDDEDLIRWEQEAAGVELHFTKHQTEHKITLKWRRNARREFSADEQPLRHRDLIGLFHVVIFSPEDLFLIKGTPAGRRRFLDSEISQANPLYFRQLLQYNRILLQRNQLLKAIREQKQPLAVLDTWDQQLAPVAVSLIGKRVASVRKLTVLANVMQQQITDQQENLSLTYEQHGYEDQDVEKLSTALFTAWYGEELRRRRQEDIARGSTSIGPHRDDLRFAVNGADLRSYGSQGQQRTGILAVKLAEIEFIKAETGEYPVLLLDDVLSELDQLRREQLLGFIEGRIQTVITVTDAEQVAGYKNAKYFYVHHGVVSE